MFHEIHVETGVLNQIVRFPLVPYLLSVGERNSLVSICKIISSNGKTLSCCQFLEVIFLCLLELHIEVKSLLTLGNKLLFFTICIKFSLKYLVTMSSTE